MKDSKQSIHQIQVECTIQNSKLLSIDKPLKNSHLLITFTLLKHESTREMFKLAGKVKEDP